GSRLASCDIGGTIIIWTASGQKLRTLQGYGTFVNMVAWHPDRPVLASADKSRTVSIWNVETGQEEQTLQGHTYDVRGVSFSADGKLLASNSQDNTVRLWR